MNLKTKFDINLKNLIDKIGKFDWYLLEEQLYQNPKYKDSKRITHYGKSVFSQNGEFLMEKISKFSFLFFLINSNFNFL